MYLHFYFEQFGNLWQAKEWLHLYTMVSLQTVNHFENNNWMQRYKNPN
jgi:hypothetical protein